MQSEKNPDQPSRAGRGVSEGPRDGTQVDGNPTQSPTVQLELFTEDPSRPDDAELRMGLERLAGHLLFCRDFTEGMLNEILRRLDEPVDGDAGHLNESIHHAREAQRLLDEASGDLELSELITEGDAA